MSASRQIANVVNFNQTSSRLFIETTKDSQECAMSIKTLDMAAQCLPDVHDSIDQKWAQRPSDSNGAIHSAVITLPAQQELNQRKSNEASEQWKHGMEA